MPLFRRRPSGPGPSEPDTPAPQPQLPHVLVADDNATVTKLLSLMFEQAGWTVAVANTGRECLHAIEERLPDVVVLDQRFYFGLNGLETAELARERGFDRPILLFSAHLDDEARKWAAQLDVLPVSKVDIQAVVRLVNAASSAYKTQARAKKRDHEPVQTATTYGARHRLS